MYKGYKVTRQLQEYIRLAQKKFYKLTYHNKADLWEIISSYSMLARQEECMQKYIYDYIVGKGIYEGEYIVTKSVNGCLYVKEARG